MAEQAWMDTVNLTMSLQQVTAEVAESPDECFENEGVRRQAQRLLRELAARLAEDT